MDWGFLLSKPREWMYNRIMISARQRRLSKEEIARRGGEIYERDIKPLVEAGNKGKFVLVDVESGLWEMDCDEMAAAKRLDDRVSDPQVWMVRVGFRTAYRLGGGGLTLR
jgi:hypothetical protein